MKYDDHKWKPARSRRCPNRRLRTGAKKGIKEESRKNIRNSDRYLCRLLKYGVSYDNMVFLTRPRQCVVYWSHY